MTASPASLGELAVRAGILPERDRTEIARWLRSEAREGRATSMAHSLLRRGVPLPSVEQLLGAGGALPSVGCDGCGHPTPSAAFNGRQGRPCERCGVLNVPFAPFAPAPPAPTPAEAEAAGSRTLDFSGVVPLPGQLEPISDAEATSQFDQLTTPVPPPGVPNPFESVEFDPSGPTLMPTAAGEFDPSGPTLRPTNLPPDRAGMNVGARPLAPPHHAPSPAPPSVDRTIEVGSPQQQGLSGPIPALAPAGPQTGSGKRRRSAPSPPPTAVPSPPALWPWVTCLVLLGLVAAAEVVAHLLL